MNEPQDWSGEAGSSSEKFEADELVRLPIGILKDDELYREVVVEQMCGIDDHNISTKNPGDNGNIATSLVLCRCIQEVPGLLTRKQDPEKMFDRALARNMTNPDRDYILARIYMMGGRNEAVMAGKCSRCEEMWEEDVRLSELPVIEWPEDKPREIEFTLETGFRVVEKGVKTYHKDGAMKIPMGKEAELVGKIRNPAAALDAMIASSVVRVGDLTSVDQSMAKRLTSTDRQLFILTAQQELPGLRQWKDIECNCGGNVELRLDLTSFLDARRRKTKK